VEVIQSRKKGPELPTVVPRVMRVSGESIRPSDRAINSAKDVDEGYEVIVVFQGIFAGCLLVV
jgi:hypothetical protein